MNLKKMLVCFGKLILIIGVFLPINVSAIEAGKRAYEENCKACHAVDRFSTGPSLVYIRDNYPDNELDAFLEWVKAPGKKNPDTIQMPPMGHLKPIVITQIHEYILAVSKHVKERKNKPKFPPFKRPARTFPYVTRGVFAFTNPASISVSLSPKLSIVWDSYIGKVRYAYPTSVSVKGEKKLEKKRKNILYKEHEQSGFSFAQGQKIQFKGYQLEQGNPIFHYQVGDIFVKEKITAGSTPNSFLRAFQMSGISNNHKQISLNLSFDSLYGEPKKVKVSHGRLIKNMLNLTVEEAKNFSVEVVLP